MTKNKERTEGIVEIRMVNPKRTGTITVRDYTDPETGEIREFVDAHGNPRVKKYTKALTVLNLEKEIDRIEYMHIKDHPLYVKGSEPILKVIDVTVAAEERISSREAALEALIEAKNLRGEKLVNFARVLGIKTLNLSESIVKDKVYDFAERLPEDFLRAFNDPNRMFKEILHRGKVKGVFSVKNGVWKYREALMGASIEEAILFLEDNQDLLPSIRKEISSIKE